MSHLTLAANKIRVIVISLVTLSLLITGCSPAATLSPMQSQAQPPTAPIRPAVKPQAQQPRT